jgi:hypothetical protein
MEITFLFRVRSLIAAWVRFFYASAMCISEDGTFYYHQFDRPTNTFTTQDDALMFGFAIARKWVDEQLETG